MKVDSVPVLIRPPNPSHGSKGVADEAQQNAAWVETPYIQKRPLGKALYSTEIIKGGSYSYNLFQGRACYNGFEGNSGT